MAHATLARLMIAAVAVAGAPLTLAQTKAPAQVVKPPVSQAWIDVATFAGFGMPGMGTGGASPMSMLGGMFGGGQAAKNTFGNTQTSSAGRWVDVTLYTSRNPSLAEALQNVPAGTQLAPTLKLVAPKIDRPAPSPHDEDVVPQEVERPKGKMYLYWGCGETVRAGQPRVLDMATAKPDEFGKFFTSRRATQRGAHAAAGRPLWPNEVDSRLVPAGATLVGEHAFSGQGVPDGFKFGIPAAQDLMPEIALKQGDVGGATQLEWGALPTARAYFIAAMGAKGGMGGGSDAEMVFWTSSEVPELGSGLIDYQTNAGGRSLAEGEGAARAQGHPLRGAEGHLRRRRRRDAAHDRLRIGAERRSPAAAGRSEDRMGTAVGRQGAREERDERDAGHGHERNAGRRGGALTTPAARTAAVRAATPRGEEAGRKASRPGQHPEGHLRSVIRRETGLGAGAPPRRALNS